MCEISIIVPVYNRKKYFENTVRSILNQTFHDFELLLIDDGSTDGTGDVCDRLASSDERIKIFHTPNRGVSAARNLGIVEASGKYISFIDADDCIDETFLEKLYRSATENDSELAVCDYYEIKAGKKIIHDHKNFNTGNKTFEVLRQNLLCILWNKLFVRKKIKHFFDESVSTCEDSLFCARYYYDNNPKVSYVNEALYGYMVHNDGLTSVYQQRAFFGVSKFLKINRMISERIIDEHLKKAAIHHVYRVYYYGLFFYVFENLSKERMNAETLNEIGKVVNDKKYQRIIRYILIYPWRDKRAEKTGMTEFIIMALSLLKMKRAIYIFSKTRICLKQLLNLW